MPIDMGLVTKSITLDGSPCLFELQEHLFGILLSISWAMHWVVDDEVSSAELVDDLRIAVAPVLSEVFLDNLQVLCLLLSGHLAADCFCW